MRTMRAAFSEQKSSSSHPRLGSPWRCIRNEDGHIIGHINLRPFKSIPAQQERLTEDAVGEEPSVWSVGYSLDPGYRHMGVMSSVLGLLLDEWVRKWMRVDKVVGVRLPSTLAPDSSLVG